MNVLSCIYPAVVDEIEFIVVGGDDLEKIQIVVGGCGDVGEDLIVGRFVFLLL